MAIWLVVDSEHSFEGCLVNSHDESTTALGLLLSLALETAAAAAWLLLVYVVVNVVMNEEKKKKTRELEKRKRHPSIRSKSKRLQEECKRPQTPRQSEDVQ